MGYGIVVNGSIGSILIIVIKPVAVIIAFNDQFYQGGTVISNAWFSSSLILHPLGLVYRFSINVTVAFEFCYRCFEIWKSEFWCLKFFKCFFFVISCSVLNNFHGFDDVQKNGTRYFYQPSVWESLEILNAFNILTLKQIFLKSKTFFKKLEYRFLVQNNRIKSSTFPYETALSEANVKANTIGSTRDGPLAKNRVLPVDIWVVGTSNYLFIRGT